MSYRITLGDTTVTTTPVAKSNLGVSLQLMGLASIPWLPVLGGMYVGKKVGGDDGRWLGAISGFTLSVVAMTCLLRKAVP